MVTTLEQFIGPLAAHAVLHIEDESVRSRVIDALRDCQNTLGIVGDLDLEKHELAELGTPDVSTWNEVAPDVRNMLVAVRGTANRLTELFPASPDLDSAEQAPEEPGVADMFGICDTDSDAARDVRDEEIDRIVENAGLSAQECLGQAISTLSNMLKQDFIAFGAKLRCPDVAADRWTLLGELQEFRSTCERCLDAVVATILNTFSGEDLDQLMPRYRNATMRAVRLRGALADLSYDLDRFNQDFQLAAGSMAAVLGERLLARLEVFAGDEVYRFVRAPDKHMIIMLRLNLATWQKGETSLHEFNHQLDDAAKYLEMRRSMEEKEQLADHDRTQIDVLLGALEHAQNTEILPGLELLYGRSQELDEQVRRYRKGAPPPASQLASALKQMQAKLGLAL